MLPEHDFLLWSSHLLLTSTYNNKSVSHSKNNKDAVTPICKENKVRSVPLLSKTQLLHVQVVPACGSEELLEATVGRSGCCWCRDVSPLSMGLSAAPKAIPPAHPLYLTWQTGAYGCLLMLCCSYVLSGLMVHRGSGDLHGEGARRDLQRVGCIHGKWSGQRSLWCVIRVTEFWGMTDRHWVNSAKLKTWRWLMRTQHRNQRYEI